MTNPMSKVKGCIAPTLCISVVFLAGCSPAQNLIRPGATVEQMQLDREECRAEVMRSYSQPAPTGYGAAMNYYSANNLTMAMLGPSEFADCLKRHGFVNVTMGAVPPLFDAVTRGDAAAVRALLDNGADVNGQISGEVGNGMSVSGVTVLMDATFEGHLDVVQLLLDKEADVNAKDSNGRTALMIASQNGHLDVVQALLSKGADVNAKRNDGATPMTLAKDPEVKTLLVQAGARP
ncbi:MAG: ankyrin repeat domain-containing protein [Roseiarcus sp.]